MSKTLLMSAAVVLGATSFAAAAPTLKMGRSVSMRHHHMRMHRHHHHYYGIGSFGEGHRTTATGGNAGGYSTRN